MKAKSIYIVKVIFLLLLVTGVIKSCKKDDETPIIDYRDLGYGYDFFDEYAKPDKVKTIAILDQKKLEENGYVYYERNEVTDFSTLIGETLDEYRSKFSQEVGVSGSFKGFTASVKTNFSRETYSAIECSFATCRSSTLKRKIGIHANVTVDQLKECLTSTARQAIDNLTATELFYQYGTHVIAAFRLGGTLNYHFAANTSRFTSTQDIGVMAEAGFKSEVAEISVTSNTEVSTEINSRSSEVSRRLVTTGGNSTYGIAIAVGNTEANNLTNYRAWAASFKDEATWMLFGFDKLIPIWELASTETRENELKNAFNTWAEDRDKILADERTAATLKIDAFGLYNYEVGDKGTTPEFVWKIIANIGDDFNDHIVSQNTSENTALHCANRKFSNFGTQNESESMLDLKNYEQVVIPNVAIQNGLELKITPLLEEADGNDLGTAGGGNDIYCTEAEGPFIYFKLVGTDWTFNRLEGGCSALLKDEFIPVTYSCPLGTSRRFDIRLRQNNGNSNDECMYIIMRLNWGSE